MGEGGWVGGRESEEERPKGEKEREWYHLGKVVPQIWTQLLQHYKIQDGEREAEQN